MSSERRKLAAVFFSDMVGFSAQMDADEAKTLELLHTHNALMEAEIERQEGRVVKTVGDAFMVEFGSAVQATCCALDCLRSLRDYNVSVALEEEIHIRIGIHVGDVVERGSDLFGEVVNIAARLESMAPADTVCVSGAVFQQVRKKVKADGEDLGGLSLHSPRALCWRCPTRLSLVFACP